jgi:hypothetical protein
MPVRLARVARHNKQIQAVELKMGVGLRYWASQSRRPCEKLKRPIKY